jgi:hypothetical protein
MKLHNVYYKIKPLIPRRLQISLRRRIAARKRKAFQSTWPINPAAAAAPAGWNGWPEGKRFALILTHDVDTAVGRDKCLPLMELEQRLGFRSCFNFVPEDYLTPDDLRAGLVGAGFEVGVHGLKHDGKLFASRRIFDESAGRINAYLKKWGAVGFRAPAMHHNLEWIAELNLEYDSSTFDTDPFEPQSDDCATIFPYVYTHPSTARRYIELPYTLAQDHGLFIILREKTIGIWKEKLDWIVENGGMALLNTHPDYMNFGAGPHAREEYPISYFSDFLDYVKTRYAGQYWHVLPRTVAEFWSSTHV